MYVFQRSKLPFLDELNFGNGFAGSGLRPTKTLEYLNGSKMPDLVGGKPVGTLTGLGNTELFNYNQPAGLLKPKKNKAIGIISQRILLLANKILIIVFGPKMLPGIEQINIKNF